MKSASQHFKDHVPLKLRAALARAVADGCVSAYAQAKAKDREFFLDALPVFRRIEVESNLSKLILPAGFEAAVLPTNSTHYTKIYSQNIVLTAVTRSERVTWVEPYSYRKTLARSSQMTLFGADNPEADAALYALLVYGGPHHYKIPTMAEIVFPTPTGFFADNGIDLITEHPEALNRHATESLSAPANPKLRTKRKPSTGE